MPSILDAVEDAESANLNLAKKTLGKIWPLASDVVAGYRNLAGELHRVDGLDDDDWFASRCKLPHMGMSTQIQPNSQFFLSLLGRFPYSCHRYFISSFTRQQGGNMSFTGAFYYAPAWIGSILLALSLCVTSTESTGQVIAAVGSADENFGKGGYRLGSDCNKNGVEDGQDFAAGVLHDRDSSGVADECEADGKSSTSRDGFELSIAYDAKHATVVINYSLSRDGRDVLLQATNVVDSTQVVLVSKRRSKGQYGVKWLPSTSNGHPLASGRWQVALSVDGVTIAEPVMWDWRKVML